MMHLISTHQEVYLLFADVEQKKADMSFVRPPFEPCNTQIITKLDFRQRP